MSAIDTNTDALPSYQAELVKRARDLFPLIRGAALEAERERHLPDETVDAFKRAGLVRTLQPRRWGGHEASFETAFEVGMELGRADGSHAWVLNYYADHSYLLALFPEGAQRDVWGEDEDALIATSFAPSGEVKVLDDGYEISGSWAWASGIKQSTWIIVGALIFGGDHPEYRLFVVPRSDFAVEDVWHNAGLRGTGSDTVTIDKAFVPAHRTMTMDLMREAQSPGAEVNESPLYRVPVVAIYEYAQLGPAIGAARGAVDAWIEWSKPKVHSYTGEQVAANSPQQIRLATVEGKIDMAELLVRRAIAVAETWEPMTMPERIRNRRRLLTGGPHGRRRDRRTAPGRWRQRPLRHQPAPARLARRPRDLDRRRPQLRGGGGELMGATGSDFFSATRGDPFFRPAGGDRGGRGVPGSGGRWGPSRRAPRWSPPTRPSAPSRTG